MSDPCIRCCAVALGAMLAAGAWAPASATLSGQATTETTHMPADASNVTRVAREGVALEVRFDPAASGAFKVGYRLRNDGQTPLMVFDRGNRHAVLTKQLVQGEVAAPMFAQQAGDLTISHRAPPRPNPTPIIPPTPLAARVEPGATLEGAFEFSLLTKAPVERVRWCLGVIPFANDFRALKPEPDKPEVWLGSLSHAERQQLLCTPWFDLAGNAFEPAS